MKFFWFILLLLIVLGVAWLVRRGSSGGAAGRQSHGDRPALSPAGTVPGAAAGAATGLGSTADEGGYRSSIFDPVDQPAPVEPPTPVRPATLTPAASAEPADRAEPGSPTESPDQAEPAGLTEAASASHDDDQYQPRRGAGIDDSAEKAAVAAAPASDDAPASGDDSAAAAPDSEPAGTDESAPAEADVQQPRWTTSQWDADHTVGEEQGDPAHPHFDDETSAEPAQQDAAGDALAAKDETAVGDAEVADDTPDELLAEAAEGAESEPGALSGEAETTEASQDDAPETASDAEVPANSADAAREPEPQTDDVEEDAAGDALAAKDDAAVGGAELADEPARELLTEAAEGAESEDPGLDPFDESSDPDADGGPDEGGWVRRISSLEEVRDGGYGVGSAATFQDRAMPLGHPVKAWEDTKSYVTPDHPAYDSAEPHVWFHDAEAAQQAGFHAVD